MKEIKEGRSWADMPPLHMADYKSTQIRGPSQKPIKLTGDFGGVQSFQPAWPNLDLGDADLTRNGRINGEPIGERMVLEGVIRDEDGKPVPGALIEIWQANSAGRYTHKEEIHDAPLDPNFLGTGRCLSGPDGSYRFITIKPGSYPWGNHHNAWRPAHIHFSVFGCGLAQRLITQLYFQGDPTLPYDPIFNAISDAAVRNRLIARFSMEETVADWAHCYKFDITLAGAYATPFEENHDHG